MVGAVALAAALARSALDGGMAGRPRGALRCRAVAAARGAFRRRRRCLLRRAGQVLLDGLQNGQALADQARGKLAEALGPFSTLTFAPASPVAASLTICGSWSMSIRSSATRSYEAA